MHKHPGHFRVCEEAGHVGIRPSARDVVDDLGAILQRRPRHLRVHRVDADRNALPRKLFDDRQNARSFHLGVDAGGARPGRLAADVDDGGTIGGQRDTVADGAVRVDKQPTVGERVIGDVDDPHHLHPRVAHYRRIRSSASDRDAASTLNWPRTAEVVVTAPGLRTPRIAMQRCSASTTTITPRGLSLFINASAICAVSRSCTWGRLAYRSTTRAIFDNPVTRPSSPGM